MATDDRNRIITSAQLPQPIKVRQLRSAGPGTQLPPPGKGTMLAAGKRPTGETVTISYEPWQRHHRVREIDEDGVLKNEVCIPEGWVAYTPASEE
jgi:hypothetical protein